MVRVTLAETDGALVADAVRVTVFPTGTYAGAVYSMAMLLPTWTGFRDPQATLAGSRAVLGLPPQFRLQSTPRFGPSPFTGKLAFAVALTITEVIAAPLVGSETEIAPSRGRAAEHPASARTAHRKEKRKRFDHAERPGRY